MRIPAGLRTPVTIFLILLDIFLFFEVRTSLWLEKPCPRFVPPSAEELTRARTGLMNADWQRVSSPEGFSIEFPTSQAENVHVGAYGDGLIFEDNHGRYVATVVPAWPLHSFIPLDFELLCHQPISIHMLDIGDEGLEYVIEDIRGLKEPRGPDLTFARYIREQGSMYSLQARVPLGESAGYQRFVDSFQVLRSAQHEQ